VCLAALNYSSEILVLTTMICRSYPAWNDKEKSVQGGSGRFRGSGGSVNENVSVGLEAYLA